MKIHTLILCLVLLAGCDSNTVIDTLTAERVRITDRQPPDGQAGTPYSFRITAKVENSQNDSEFDYRFKLEDGTVPQGTEFVTHRKMGDDFAEVKGIPIATGAFTFVVSVKSIMLEDERDKASGSGDNRGNSQIDPDDEGFYTITVR